MHDHDDDGTWKISIQNFTRIALISPGSPSFTTHSLYLSCTSHSSRNLQSPSAHGMSNRRKSKLAKRTNSKQSLQNFIANMDARSRSLLAPSGDYVVVSPSGDYSQPAISPKSTNRICCFTLSTVLLPTSVKLTRGI